MEKENKEYIRLYKENWYLKNKKRISEKNKNDPNKTTKNKKNYEQWHQKYPEREMLCQSRSRAIEKNIEWALEESDIKIPNKCPILGILIYRGKGKACDNSPTIDRIDNSRGYVKDNIHVISHRANRIKSDSSFEEFEKIYKYWKKIKK